MKSDRPTNRPTRPETKTGPQFKFSKILLSRSGQFLGKFSYSTVSFYNVVQAFYCWLFQCLLLLLLGKSGRARKILFWHFMLMFFIIKRKNEEKEEKNMQIFIFFV